MANFNPNQWEWKGEKYEVKPGQFITSLDSIVKECGKGISTQNVRTALIRFEKLGFLTNEPTKEGRLVTIANWSLYQCDNKQPNKPNNKDLTNDSQTPNKDLTPKEECNKVKKEKNVFIPPTLEEIQAYITEKGYNVDANKFFNYYDSGNWTKANGKKVANWKQTIVTWDSKNDNQSNNNLEVSYLIKPGMTLEEKMLALANRDK